MNRLYILGICLQYCGIVFALIFYRTILFTGTFLRRLEPNGKFPALVTVNES